MTYKQEPMHMTEETCEILTKNLNDIILSCLGGPAGDPDQAHIEAATIAFRTLKLLNLQINNEKDISDFLKNNNDPDNDPFWYTE